MVAHWLPYCPEVFTGIGITVGVISDSYNYLGGAAASQMDLPETVTVLEDGACSPAVGGCIDEGRAMMEVIHDVAPGASLAHHSAFLSELSFAQGIRELAQAGSRVIVDDYYYESEPFFQDGIIAQAVDTVVAAGSTYFSSAGNGGRIAYEGDFVAGGTVSIDFGGMVGVVDYTAHDFDTSLGVDVFQQFTLPLGASVTFSFQWDEPSIV